MIEIIPNRNQSDEEKRRKRIDNSDSIGIPEPFDLLSTQYTRSQGIGLLKGVISRCFSKNNIGRCMS
jgi:hypothetical protein